MSELVTLSSGAELRLSNGRQERAVLCVNGGQRAEVPGTWSATIEWLVERLAPRFPALSFGEVRYRTKSWTRLDDCIADARAGIAELGGDRVTMLGFSMGGAVSISVADDPRVERVIGLAPWIPDQLGVETLHGKRLDVLHGSLDRYLPGVPGVTTASSRRGYERARALGAGGSYTVIRGGLHGVAIRAPGVGLLPLPRAGLWLRLLAAQLDVFAA